MKTYSAKPTEVERKWYLIDAKDAPLGRISTEAAKLLIGKGKPMFTKHIDTGDFVVIINTDELVLTGNKAEKKVYYRHTHYPGGLKSRTFEEQSQLDSTYVITHSIRGMLPVNKLRADRLARLKVYAGSEHKHEAQSPVKVNIGETK